MAFGDADASTPGFASVNANWTTTGATSAAFSPPAGSLVRLWVFADTSSGANPGQETVTDSLAGATGWTFQGRRSKPDSGAQAGSVALFTKFYAAAPGSIAVTVIGNATGAAAGGFSTKVVAGCTGVEGVAEGSNTAAVMSIGVTTVSANARCEMAGTDWNVQAAPTAGAGQSVVLSSSVGTGPDTRVCVIIQNAVTAVAGTTETCSTGSPSAGNANNFMGLAYTPAAGGTTHNATAATATTAALTTTGAVTAAGTAGPSTAATLTATGAVTAAAASSPATTAALTSVGTVTAAAAGSPSTTAALTVTATRIANATAALTTTAALTVAGSTGNDNAAPAGTTAALTATATVAAAAASSYATTAALTVTATVTSGDVATRPPTDGPRLPGVRPLDSTRGTPSQRRRR